MLAGDEYPVSDKETRACNLIRAAEPPNLRDSCRNALAHLRPPPRLTGDSPAGPLN
jgi:hypothetical protein